MKILLCWKEPCHFLLAEKPKRTLTLFPENARRDADETIFYKQLAEDHNFVYLNGEDVCGFVSYHKFMGYDEITSLYVKKDMQRMKVGHHLLAFVENQIRGDRDTMSDGTDVIIKVLNNAPWALDFYRKHGYTALQNGHSLAEGRSLLKKPWETILCKRVGL